MKNLPYPRSRGARRGGALVGVLFVAAALALLSLSTVSLTTAAMREQGGWRRDVTARYVADAGIGAAVFALRSGLAADQGNAEQPVEFGGGTYWVERRDLAGGLFSLVSTGDQNGSTVRVEAVLRAQRQSMFTYGAFGDEFMGLASNATVDSYLASEGTYASQAINGSGGHPYANQNGTVGSNGNVTLRQNSRVHGDAAAGPEGVTTVMGNAVVSGATTPSTTRVELPPIEFPDYVSLGPLSVPGNSVATLPAGPQRYGAAQIGSRARLTVSGPATLVFDSLVVRSNAQLLFDTTNGPVEVYVHGDFILNSNTLFAPLSRNPADLALNLNTDNVINPDQQVDLDEVDFDSNSKLFGTIYAPRASVHIDSNFELFGAIVARRLVLDSYAKVHYDETLVEARGGAPRDFEVVAWRLLSREDRGGANQ